VTPKIFGIWSNISPKLLELETSNLVHGFVWRMTNRRTKISPESGRGLGHVTPTIFGSTVGYPSDSLASCLDMWQGWIRHLTSPEHSKSPSEGCPKIEDAHLVVLVIPGYAPRKSNLLTLASTQYTQDWEHWKHLVETTTLQLGACSWWWWWSQKLV